AAILIQKWYRMYVARLEARRRYTWTIFQSIEYSGEQDQLKLHNFFNSMINQLKLDTDGQPKIARAFASSQRPAVVASETSDISGCIEGIEVESSYTGPHLTFPITHAQVKTLIQAFKAKRRLHVRYLLELLNETQKLFKQMKNINYASTSISKQITVCGDLHGKLEDLYMIFHKNGLPSVDNPFVFNGDFVDRGASSIEVSIILFACFLASPNEVFLNRGNHEDHVMNMRYGFMKEIIRKYKDYSTQVTKSFTEVFSWLPLATVIDDKVLVVHGGISQHVSLKSLARLDRHRVSRNESMICATLKQQYHLFLLTLQTVVSHNDCYGWSPVLSFLQFISVLRPPSLSEVSSLENVSLELQRLEEWKQNIFNDETNFLTLKPTFYVQVLDLLWSDPKSLMGCNPNTFRGGGCYFGPDITENFLEEHNFKLLIRSHECKPEGFEYNHDGKVLTIFSASNYYDIGSNKGAYAKLMGPDLTVHMVQFLAYQTGSVRKLTFTQRISCLEASAMQDLREKILTLKSDLMEEFKKHDTEETGTITIADWCSAMESVMDVDVPWRMLRSKLVKLNSDKRVNYESTFEELQIYHRYSEAIMEMLYRYKDSLETIFRIFDKDNSGFISMSEFTDACTLLTRHTSVNLSPNQVNDIAKSLDLNKDGQIDFNEFLEAFRIVDQKNLNTVSPRNTESEDIYDCASVNSFDEPMGVKRKITSNSELSNLET
ncbi:hypothetical protein LOTGIDRAFT_104853, partial [Lottia gigantea]